MFTPEQIKQLRLSLKLGDDVKDEAVAAAVLERLAKPDASQTKLAETQTQLTEAQALVASLQGQVAQLEQGKAPEVDTDVLEQTAELVGERLSLLVERGNISQAMADKVKPLMLGTAGNRPKIMLSAKVATAAGLPAPLHKPLMELLGELKMGVAAGQKTGPQVFGLQRPDPDAGDDRPNEETRKSMADAAYGPSTK